MTECKEKLNEKRCNCSYPGCPRKHLCCDCLHYHRSKGQLPACYFPDDVEKTYDRSVDNFIRIYDERGKIF